MVELEEVLPSEQQVRILYKLLEARRHSISHSLLPEYKCHKEFVEQHPYRVWYLVKFDGAYVGSVYLNQDNTIGVNIDDEVVGECLGGIVAKLKSSFAPLPAIRSVRAGFFAVNVPPDNEALVEAMRNIGGRVIQISFRV